MADKAATGMKAGLHELGGMSDDGQAGKPAGKRQACGTERQGLVQRSKQHES